MTVGLSATNVVNPWLNTLRGGGAGTSAPAPAALYVKLHVGDPGVGAGNAAAGSTTRVAVTLGAAASGSTGAFGTAPVWTNGGTSETLTHISVWDASTAGNFQYSVALSTPQAWASGNTFTLTNLAVSVAPLAA